MISNAKPMPLKTPLTMLLIVLGGFASAQNRSADFRVTRISRDLVPNPEYNYSGTVTFPVNGRERWLAVEVEFSAAPEFTDELTLKYFILLGGKLLTGEVTHVNILGGRELRSVMYIPPHALAHVLGNRALTVNAVENIAVQLLQQGAVKGEQSLTRSRPQWFTTVPAVTGLVVNKNETPFAPLYWDRYEQIKSPSR